MKQTDVNPAPPVDQLQRPLKDLRLSVTDRCNFRCTYCMPKEIFGSDYPYLPRKQLLSFEELTRVARLLAAAGVRKVRLTGGEPLVRRQIETLVSMLAEIEGLDDLTLTTNGSLLTREKAEALRTAGLTRITVSLDAMDDETFMQVNDVGYGVAKVLEAIENAAAAGLTPVKINMAVKRGLNEHSVIPMVRHFRGSGHILRFIEYMDVGTTNGWCMEDVVPAAELVDIIDAEFPLEPADANYGGEVAKRWRFRDGAGEIGIIASVTQPFCSSCTRARLSAEGVLYTCLFAGEGTDFRRLIREGASDEYIAEVLNTLWTQRADRYSEIRAEAGELPSKRIEMSYIGG